MNINIKIQNFNRMNVVSSRDIAEGLGKQHKHVLESIENIIKNSTADISALFIESTYIASNGKANREILLTKDGFILYMFNIQGYQDFKMAYRIITTGNKELILIFLCLICNENITQNIFSFLESYLAFFHRLFCYKKITFCLTKSYFHDIKY